MRLFWQADEKQINDFDETKKRIASDTIMIIDSNLRDRIARLMINHLLLD